MRSRIAGLCAAVCLTALPVAHGQAAAGFEPPRTSWGAPDLQGNWTNASITRMTRPAGVDALVLTPEQAKALEDGDFNNARTQAELKPTDQTVGAPAKAASLPGLGNYNAVWVDAGSKVAVVNGELRSSWIVDPPSGRIPYKGDRGAARPAPKPVKAASTKPSAKPAGKSSGQDKNAFVDAVAPPPARIPTAEAAAKMYEGPESRSLGERCLIGFGGTGGPVMNNVLYNNTYQIVQSPGYALILVEMVHDARIIPITHDRKRPDAIKPWLGDSIGWYDGDTLVV
ncbi:MAG: hypothetical protein R3C52_15930, partial [Hyphomonadaceae bacterium]